MTFKQADISQDACLRLMPDERVSLDRCVRFARNIAIARMQLALTLRR
jgi:hypothetical protein